LQAGTHHRILELVGDAVELLGQAALDFQLHIVAVQGLKLAIAHQHQFTGQIHQAVEEVGGDADGLAACG
jgi:hypothetical protein